MAKERVEDTIQTEEDTVKVCMYIHVCICVYAVILSVIASHVYLSVCMCVCMCVRIRVYTCVCICVILYLLVTLLDGATVYVGCGDRDRGSTGPGIYECFGKL
jgi:hypothetical protein